MRQNECQLRDQRPRKSLKAFFYNMRERFTEKIENSEKFAPIVLPTDFLNYWNLDF